MQALHARLHTGITWLRLALAWQQVRQLKLTNVHRAVANGTGAG